MTRQCQIFASYIFLIRYQEDICKQTRSSTYLERGMPPKLDNGVDFLLRKNGLQMTKIRRIQNVSYPEYSQVKIHFSPFML